MNGSSFPRFLVSLALAFGSSGTESMAAELRLASVWSDHAVVQRDLPIRVFGSANPGASVEAEFAGARASSRADDVGRFVVVLPSQSASSEPRSLRVASGGETIEVNDLLVGEVWLCSGQSNMEWHVDGADGAEDAARSATDPRLRVFTGDVTYDFEPVSDVKGRWEASTPQSVPHFSATAFYFGRELLSRLDVPIGLVHVSWGGSTIEAWTSLEALAPLPAARRYLDAYASYRAASDLDPAEFAAVAVDDSKWPTVPVPSYFKDIGLEGAGTVWFRRFVEVPSHFEGKPLTLTLGPIDDDDVTYWNGEKIGETSGWTVEREYVVPANLARAGRACVVVKVQNGAGEGGIYGEASKLRLGLAGGAESLSLAGEWRMARGPDLGMPDPRHRPAHLYHGMIYPLLDLRFRGAIWYQGESNALDDRGSEYYEFLPAMITDWRTRFGMGDFPFYYVQLPNFADDDDAFWHFRIVRDAQLATYRTLPNVGLAVTIDIGDDVDIHPRNKLDVGRRLARLAFFGTYGDSSVVPTGPLFRAARFEGDRARVEFDLFGATLIGKESDLGGRSTLAGFEIAGADRIFVPAFARVVGDGVEVWAESVPVPAAVRYAYEGCPEVSLWNSEGLPASPFHTDPWPNR